MAKPANPNPCSSCPWLIENHGQRHPGGWYTKKNMDRLWSKLRQGERMGCHKTDSDNPVPEGLPTVSPGTELCECTGALILQQREVTIYQDLCKAQGADAMKQYRAERPKGMTRAGMLEILSRAIFGGTFLDRVKMARPDLNAPVGHPALPWEPREPETSE